MIWDYFDDINIGDKVISRGRTITEADVVMFCMLTGNWETLHSDAEEAKTNPWGQRLVQGSLVFSLGPGLVPVATPGRVVASYGVDRIRYIKPVFIGDTIHVEHEVINKEDTKPDAGVVDVQMTFKNQRDEAVQVNTMKLLVAKKPAKEKEA